MDMLRIATAGSVDDGKSTLIGRLLYDSKAIYQDVLDSAEQHSRRQSTKHFVFCINKMDLVDYREDVFRPIQDDLHSLLIELGIKSHHFIPISAIDGDNVVHYSKRMPWYVEDPLVKHLEEVQFNDEIADMPFRMPVQYVIRPLSNELHDYRGYAGTIESGRIEVGQQIAVMPSGANTLVTDIERPNGAVSFASESDAVTIRIAGDLDISRGDMFSSPNEKPTTDNQFQATVCWMSEKTSLRARSIFRIKHTTRRWHDR